MTNNEVVNAVLLFTIHYIKNSFNLACQLSKFNGNVPSFTSLETKDTDFATKCENLFACIQYFSMCLAAAEKVLWPIIRQ